MSKKIKKYDENDNLIYSKDSLGYEIWYEYDENNNEIYCKDSEGDEYWQEFDENNNLIYYKDSVGYEFWYNNDEIEITEKEYKEIEYNIKIKEYNSRTKCSRFEIMEI